MNERFIKLTVEVVERSGRSLARDTVKFSTLASQQNGVRALQEAIPALVDTVNAKAKAEEK